MDHKTNIQTCIGANDKRCRLGARHVRMLVANTYLMMIEKQAT
jgi:hypothetical protein